jgi:hypothetical protein
LPPGILHFGSDRGRERRKKDPRSTIKISRWRDELCDMLRRGLLHKSPALPKIQVLGCAGFVSGLSQRWAKLLRRVT